MSRADVDGLITLGFIAVGFLMIIGLMGFSMDFQKRCEAACAPQASITPIVNFSESCFCDTGSGVWRRVDVSE
jgi:hypothetical protein